MDWNAAIEENREALKRVLAMLVGLAELGGATLPRQLHRFVCRLLRPAEAAARRLVIMAARGLTVPPPRPRKPKPMTMEPLLRSLGIAVMASPAGLARMAAARRAAAIRAARPRTLALPLFDRLPNWRARRRIKACDMPRIWTPGYSEPRRGPDRSPPAPDDPIDATRLALRLAALGRALDDLPGQARRFARWRARVDARLDAAIAQVKERQAAAAQNEPAAAGVHPIFQGAIAQNRKTRRRFRRVWPLRHGRPPGWQRRPTHEIHDILNVVHDLAERALNRSDTS